ncbi:MAG: WecB/TagA/CpsF family glycosyltransferase [Treponema sp.]|nr:WecB/TagA/CpsF family glycosyltransferase [Spirochaetia bacterium]MDY2840753.1 WecB/TagA/CpsF family glycosyltransferase [Treponema sp.]MDY5123297.1 WecB/TagA/CpsF family glycosyltransferase [Treponema sp.]
MAINRINLIGVPVDVCEPENLENEILEILARPGTKQIIFLSIWDLLKARHKGDFADCLKDADLILPVSKSILRGAKFLKKDVPVRYNPFTAVIQIMTIMESHFKSTYLLGSSKKTLKKAERNIHDTFPKLKIIGRYVGYYPKALENDIIQSIFKSEPSLVLLSEGIKEKNCWAYRRRNRFSSSIFLYYKDAFGIFSERIKRVKEKTFDKGNEIFVEVLHNPFKIFLIFPFLWYILILCWYKISKK